MNKVSRMISKIVKKALREIYKLYRELTLYIQNYYLLVFRGTDFRTKKRMEFSPEIGLCHEATRKNIFDLALSYISVTSENSFFDYGCGKGNALIMASAYPFKRIGGVELSHEMFEICKQNLKKHNLEKVSVFHNNATDLGEEIDNYDLFFLYNPFKANIIRIVAQQLNESIQRKPRSLNIIYHNPTQHEEFIAAGFTCRYKLNERHLDKTRRVYIYIGCLY